MADRDTAWLWALIGLAIFILLLTIPEPHQEIKFISVPNEIRVKVPGLESAYHWVKKLTSMGYTVEIFPISEPGYTFEVYGIKARL